MTTEDVYFWINNNINKKSIYSEVVKYSFAIADVTLDSK